MRLLVVSQYFWPENFRINDLVAEMVRRGHDVTILTGVPNYPSGQVDGEYRKDPSSFLVYEGARIVRVPLVPRGRGSVRLVLNYLSFVLTASLIGPWRLRGMKFDVILVYEPSPITVGIPGIILRAIKRAPLVFWVLDLWPETLKAVGVVTSDRVLRMVGWLVSYIYRRCDLILAQSKSFVPQIRQYAGSERRVKYFPSWAEGVFEEIKGEPAPEVSTEPGVFTVMFAGNVGEAQDFPAILSAAETVKGRARVRWLVVGDGRMSPWVAKEIERRGLEDSVYLLGRYPVDRMPAFFRHADALLVSLKNDAIFSFTIPGKLQSYLASGIPVIAMLNGEGASLLANSGGGLTCPAGDHKGLAEAVLQLQCMDKIERETMGHRGRALYEQEFKRELLLDRIEGWMIDMGSRSNLLAGNRGKT